VFQHQGASRTDRHNRHLAGALAAVAGFVNSSGFLLIGTFTSHVTGNVGRMTHDVAAGKGGATALALTMIAAFFAGAFVASMAIESNAFARRATTYGALLLGEAALLASFFALAQLLPSANPRVHDAEAAILCAAMGMQNSLVTRLSGAVVRTTHLTGVVTDLGIESARWFRYLRHRVGVRSRLRLTVSAAAAERPHLPKTALLATILAAFVTGGLAGAVITLQIRQLAIVLPAAALALGGIYAIAGTRELVEDGARR
jgi:uncharacterized membrane protein YoaK (UPF0700 family)